LAGDQSLTLSSYATTPASTDIILNAGPFDFRAGSGEVSENDRVIEDTLSP